MEKIVFHAYAWGSYKVYIERLAKTAKYFHPEIPFIAYDENDVKRMYQKYPFLKWFTMMAPFGWELVDKYDLVVHIDADSLITGKLTELLESDFDIASVRNQNDLGKAGAHPPVMGSGISSHAKNIAPLDEFVNAGFIASRSKTFWEEWFEMNKNAVTSNRIYNDEQDTLNVIFQSKKYKTKILDEKNTQVFYGVANAYGEHTHWDSWKKIQVINNNLYLDNKIIKVLHQAGGENPDKMNFNKLFNPDVVKYIQSIINI